AQCRINHTTNEGFMTQVGETPSVDLLGVNEAPSTIPLVSDNSDTVAKKPRGKPGHYIPPSKQPLDRESYRAFQAQSIEKKREYLKQQWLDVAYLVLGKAKLLSMSLAKKDYGRLVQLLTASGIAWDKVFPKIEGIQGNNLVLNLFNGLPKDKVVRVIGEVPQP